MRKATAPEIYWMEWVRKTRCIPNGYLFHINLLQEGKLMKLNKVLIVVSVLALLALLAISVSAKLRLAAAAIVGGR